MPGLFDGLTSGADVVVDKTLLGLVLPGGKGWTWVVQGRTVDGRWVAHKGSEAGRCPRGEPEAVTWAPGEEPARLRATLAILGRRASP